MFKTPRRTMSILSSCAQIMQETDGVVPRSMTLFSDHGETANGRNTFRLTVMGSKGVGKSTLVSRILNIWRQNDTPRTAKKHSNRFSRNRMEKTNTNLDEFEKVRGKHLKVDIITTTIEQCSSERLPYCDAFVLVYSLTSDSSFNTVRKLRLRILKSGCKCPIIFIANKTDAAKKVDQQLRNLRGLNISCEWNHPHIETSAEQDNKFDNVLVQILKGHTRTITPLRNIQHLPHTDSKEKRICRLIKNILKLS